jgi:GT2 family glycosyltransferase
MYQNPDTICYQPKNERMVKVVCIIPSALSTESMKSLLDCVQALQVAQKSVHLSIHIVTTNQNIKPHTPNLGKIRIYQAKPNSGFGQMNNLVIEKTIKQNHTDYYLFINDDAYVSPSFFREFSNLLKKNSPDLLNPIIYTPSTDTIDSYGVEYFHSGYAKNAGVKNIQTTLATAACLLVKTSFLKKMKKTYGFFFNPILYYYLEDVEFSIRALAIHGTIAKSDSLKAYHIGSHTSHKKSYFTIYYTYRNILWVILMTWDTSIIVKNIFSIITVQCWLIFYGTKLFGLGLYPKIYIDTLKHFRTLMKFRKTIIPNYEETPSKQKLFSKHLFRTGKGRAL